jgi:hypothetical protein
MENKRSVRVNLVGLVIVMLIGFPIGTACGQLLRPGVDHLL